MAILLVGQLSLAKTVREVPLCAVGRASPLISQGLCCFVKALWVKPLLTLELQGTEDRLCLLSGRGGQGC